MRVPFCIGCAIVLTVGTWAQEACEDPPPLQNPGFTGTGGAVVGTVTGSVPDAWRAFGVGGGAVTVEVVPLAEGELYPDSPATNAVRFQVDIFGADQAFDHDNTRFVIRPNLKYHAEFYIKSGNADDSEQGFFLGFPVFNAAGTYLGREPGTSLGGAPTSNVATGTWRKVRGMSFMDPEASQAHIAFRVANDGGTGNSIMIALPNVVVSPELASNPGFELASNGGLRVDNVTGLIPEDWRAFAVGGGAAMTDLVPLAADALFPGSLATNALRFEVTNFAGDQGVDLDISRFALALRSTYQASVYVKSGNADRSDQGFRVGFPIFGGPPYTGDPGASPYLGREPGAFAGTAGSDWQKVAGPAFEDSEARSGALSLRLNNDGGTGNAILIALPSVEAIGSRGPVDVPNPLFAGTGGTIVGDVTGTVPDGWRALAVTGDPPVPPPAIANPDFEANPDGTTAGGQDFIDITTITGWRHFGVGGVSASATVTSAAASSGAVGIELVRNNSGGDSALDKDQPPLWESIPRQERVYQVLVDARDGGPYGGTPHLGIGFQFPPTYAGSRGVAVDPGAAFETFGLTVRTNGADGLMSIRFDLGSEGGRSVHLDNVRVTDVTGNADRMVNGGFENSDIGLPNWRFFAVGDPAPTGSATLSSEARTGEHAALFEVTDEPGTGDIGFDIDPFRLATLGGEELTVSFAAKKVSGGDIRLQVVVAGFAANGAFLGNLAVLPVSPGTGAYEVFSGTNTLPDDVAFINIAFRITDAGGARTTGAYLIDDVTVVSPVVPFAPAAAEIATVPVAAGEVFPGSPAANAVIWRQTVFGMGAGVAGFDHALARLVIEPAVRYHGRVYVKTANTDAADQAFRLELTLLNGDHPVGDPATVTGTATNIWQLVEGGSVASLTADNGYLTIRVDDDGGADDAILIALPEMVQDTSDSNVVPNPTLAGSGGVLAGSATGGPVPDDWRAFAVAGAEADIQVVPLAAGELYAGSPAVNAVSWTRTLFVGDAAVDHDAVRLPIRAGTPHRASVWAKTANADESPQQAAFGFPIFDGSTFLGREPGSFGFTATKEWVLYQGPVFTDPVANNGHVAVRVLDNGGENAVLFALPRVEVVCPAISAVQPAFAMNRENLVEVLVTGANFPASGVRVFLAREGGPDIAASNVRVTNEQTLTLDLNIMGALPGVYDVMICPSPGCPAATLIEAFTIGGCGIPFADTDQDGDVDQKDFGAFQLCITGSNDPGGSFDAAQCGCFDHDGDQDVDGFDLGRFINCVSGPNLAADPACGN